MVGYGVNKTKSLSPGCYYGDNSRGRQRREESFQKDFAALTISPKEVRTDNVKDENKSINEKQEESSNHIEISDIRPHLNKLLTGSDLHEEATTDDSINSSNGQQPAKEFKRVNSFDNEFHPLVRKKSGEIVKPSLKEQSVSVSSKGRSSSLPATPTYKQVHFGGDNDVRYFKEKDRPTSISTSNSPMKENFDFFSQSESSEFSDSYEPRDDNMYEYGDRGSSNFVPNFVPNFNLELAMMKGRNQVDQNQVDWSLELVNFPDMSYLKRLKKSPIVFLDKVFLSIDKEELIGHIAVKNLAFQKSVRVRYTSDNWQTFTETRTSYDSSSPTLLLRYDYDRFVFRMLLNSVFNTFGMHLKDPQFSSNIQRTFQFCIRYEVNNQEYWDNNNNMNYEFKLVRRVFRSKAANIEAHERQPKYSSSFLNRKHMSRASEGEKEDSRFQRHDENNSQNDVINKKTKPRKEDVENRRGANCNSGYSEQYNGSTMKNHPGYKSASYEDFLKKYCFSSTPSI